MLRIIFGVLILLGQLGSFAQQSTLPEGVETVEMVGYYFAKVAFLILAFWLIHSGIRKVRNRPPKKS